MPKVSHQLDLAKPCLVHSHAALSPGGGSISKSFQIILVFANVISSWTLRILRSSQHQEVVEDSSPWKWHGVHKPKTACNFKSSLKHEQGCHLKKIWRFLSPYPSSQQLGTWMITSWILHHIISHCIISYHIVAYYMHVIKGNHGNRVSRHSLHRNLLTISIAEGCHYTFKGRWQGARLAWRQDWHLIGKHPRLKYSEKIMSGRIHQLVQ